MRHIRTKLVLSLLVVTLIPLIPSYYLIRGLVNHSFEFFFNETVETAIEGSARISRELYRHYKKETLELASELARSRAVVGLLKDESPQRGGATQDLSEAAIPLGACVIDLYDAQNQRVASLARLGEDPAAPEDHPEEAEKLERGPGRFGSRIREQALAFLSKESDELPLEFYRGKIDELSRKNAPEILEGSDNPRYISALVPIADQGRRLGFMIVVRVMEEEFAQGAQRIALVNKLFRYLDYNKDEYRLGIIALFVLFFGSIGALSIGVGYIFSRRLTSPLLRLVEGTRTVAAGDLDYRIQVSSRDEIGQLMDSFNKMIVSIKENQQLARERELERQRVEEENQRRVKDLEVSELRARALQAENERKTIELQKSQELERAYQELEESHRQLQEAQTRIILQEKMASLGSMVAGVAHEINNPMGAVHSAVDVSGRCVGRVEQCVTSSPSIEALRESLNFQQAVDILKDNVQVIRVAEERITTLVRSLKNFARLDEAEFQMIDLREGLDTTLTLLQQQIGPNIQVQKNYGEIPRTYGSPGQLNQVFMNVLKNAAQAIEGEGEIAIQTFREGSDLFVKIADTGMGIPPEQLDHIFDLGFSAKSSRVKMGSGLSMAYRIVQEHKGRIEIQSEPGKGTEVTICLPVREGRDEKSEA